MYVVFAQNRKEARKCKELFETERKQYQQHLREYKQVCVCVCVCVCHRVHVYMPQYVGPMHTCMVEQYM